VELLLHEAIAQHIAKHGMEVTLTKLASRVMDMSEALMIEKVKIEHDNRTLTVECEPPPFTINLSMARFH
ncbi:hypothetical protein, partial [Endozoicomonas sp. SESOKO4]|uniref:hypothetical protein n=1 Tax=Endozoicomonas sp. SESOKO4 TaxID=2828745 RepID=UPI00214907BD